MSESNSTALFNSFTTRSLESFGSFRCCYTQTHTDTHRHTHTYTHTHSHTHTYAGTQIHTHMHAQTQTHIHTIIISVFKLEF